MDDRRELTRRLCEDLHGDLLKRRVETGVCPLRDNAGKSGQPLCPTDCLEILVKDLIRGDAGVGRKISNIRIFRRNTVLKREIWITSRTLVPAVARETGHARPSREEVLVDGVHHRDHLARSPDPRGLQGKRRPVQGRFRRVAEGAVVPHCIGKHSHRVEKSVDRNALEQGDALKDLVRHRRSVLRVLCWPLSRLRRGFGAYAGCHRTAEQTHHGNRRGTKEGSRRPELHVCLSLA